MPTYKRHIVYLSDEEWERLTQRAKEGGTTISAYLRSVAGVGRVPSALYEPHEAGTDVTTRKAQQSERDAILRKVNRGG